MTTAAASFRRLATILPRLADGSEVRINHLADAAGVDEPQLLRDLQQL